MKKFEFSFQKITFILKELILFLRSVKKNLIVFSIIHSTSIYQTSRCANPWLYLSKCNAVIQCGMKLYWYKIFSDKATLKTGFSENVEETTMLFWIFRKVRNLSTSRIAFTDAQETVLITKFYKIFKIQLYEGTL